MIGPGEMKIEIKLESLDPILRCTRDEKIVSFDFVEEMNVHVII